MHESITRGHGGDGLFSVGLYAVQRGFRRATSMRSLWASVAKYS